VVDGGEPGVDSRDEGKHTGLPQYEKVPINVVKRQVPVFERGFPQTTWTSHCNCASCLKYRNIFYGSIYK